MQNENTTGINRAQHPDLADPALDPTLFPLVPEVKRHDVAAMLLAERKHASTWWTILNEMRCRNLLPEWAVEMGAGSHPSWDKWNAACRTSNLALLAYDGHLNAVVHPVREFATQNAKSENVARESEVQP